MKVPDEYVEGAFHLSTQGSSSLRDRNQKPETSPDQGARPRRRADAVRNRSLALDAATALLAEPGATLTVETIAKRAGLGAGTVVRAFGGKDALIDAAVSALLEPVVQRARDLLATSEPYRALRLFLPELMAFQAAHHTVSDQLAGLDLPATTALRAELNTVAAAMVEGARRDGALRTDLDPAITNILIGETALAVARAEHGCPGLTAAYLRVLFDGLAPRGGGQETDG